MRGQQEERDENPQNLRKDPQIVDLLRDFRPERVKNYDSIARGSYTIFKLSEDLNRHEFKDRHGTIGSKHMEKILAVTGHQRNANQSPRKKPHPARSVAGITKSGGSTCR